MISLLAVLLAVVTTPYAPVSYACDGLTSAYTVNFPYLASTDILVTSTTPAGISSTLAITTDYTLNVTSTSSTASLTLLSPGTKCPSGNTLKIARNSALTQPTSFRQQTSFSPSTVEAMADRTVMEVQQVNDKVSVTGAVASTAYVDQAIAATLTGGLVVQPITWALVGDGTTTTFTIPNAVVNSPDLYQVTIDGLVQAPTTDYTVSTSPAQIAFTFAPALNATISVRSTGYARALSVGDSTSVLATGTSVPRDLAHRAGDVFNVKDFGAKGDGATDDTVAIQSAVTASGSGGKVYLPGGKYKVSSTITFRNMRGFHLEGSGTDFNADSANATTFIWGGNNTASMFLTDDVANSYFGHFSVLASSSVPLAVAFESVNGAGVTIAPTGNKFENVMINGTNTGGLQKGFWFHTGAGGDNNNSDMIFDNVIVTHYDVAGWLIESTQSFGHRFYSCGCGGNGLAGSNCFKGPGLAWYAGNGGGNGGADFFLESPQVNFSIISGADFEGSGRFIETGGPSGASGVVVLEGNRWTSDAINADHRAIVFQISGPLVLIGNGLGSDTTIPMEVFVNVGAHGQVLSYGNSYATTLATPFTSAPQLVTSFGDQVTNAGVTSVLIGKFSASTFANLGTPTAGSITYCSDCTIANPCAGAGTGAIAKRLNGVWVCN